MKLDHQTIQELLLNVSYAPNVPSFTDLIQMVDMLEVFIEDTRSCVGITVYQPLNDKHKQPDGFDYKRDVTNAMIDFYIDHPLEPLKWNIPFKFYIEPLIVELCSLYSHVELLEQAPGQLSMVRDGLSKCHDASEFTSYLEVKSSYQRLAKLTKERNSIHSLSSILLLMRK